MHVSCWCIATRGKHGWDKRWLFSQGVTKNVKLYVFQIPNSIVLLFQKYAVNASLLMLSSDRLTGQSFNVSLGPVSSQYHVHGVIGEGHRACSQLTCHQEQPCKQFAKRRDQYGGRHHGRDRGYRSGRRCSGKCYRQSSSWAGSGPPSCSASQHG